MSIIENMKAVLGEAETEELDGKSTTVAVQNNLALIAQTMGIDLNDEPAVDEFLDTVRTVVTKGRAQLKSKLHAFNKAKQSKTFKNIKQGI